MPEETPPPEVLPGDLVQVSVTRWQGAVVVVQEVKAWGLTGYVPALDGAGPTTDMPARLKHGEYVPVGVSAVMTPDLIKARLAARETAAIVARETAGPLSYEVEVRFNGRLSGARQSWSGRVEATSPHEAVDRAVGNAVRDARHGGSLFVTGFTVDEVRA